MRSDELSLGAMVRVWRDRLSPAAVGRPAGGARRAVGLRREELAELTGISVDYLARLAPPADGEISGHIPPGIGRVLNRLGDAAVGVFAADWQLIWWNRGWAALLGDPSSTPPTLRNFARDSFGVNGDSPRLSHWPVISFAVDSVEAAIVSDLRRATGRFPNSRRLTQLVQVLVTGSPRFAGLWAAGAVDAHREDRKVVEHPAVGPITVDCDVMTDSDAELKIVILTAAPDTEDETKLRLAIVSGVFDVPGYRHG